ncbi:MAG: uracil-DNA glycosylase [Psychrilyobacter sp.]|nr:uracil-DNA glycosylase [Psychrilyobacter sp.]
MNISNLWDELNFEINSCKIFKQEDKDSKILLGGGNRKAKLLFIGDDPNLFEDENLRVGKNTSGTFFKNLYDLVDLSTDTFFMTNIVKCNLKLKDLSNEEKEKYSEILDMQIALLNPEIIVTMGQEATRFLMRDNSLKINDIRGKTFNWDGGIKIIPLYDPNFLMRSHDKKKGSPKWLTWKDMEAIKNLTDM